MKLLPHHYSFLLVDCVIEIDGDRSCARARARRDRERHP
jgi:hypothetical protein